MMDRMANEARAPAGMGCLSTIVGVVVLALVVGLAFVVGFIVLGIVAALLVVGLVVFAVDRVLLALSPKRRERRSSRGGVLAWRIGQDPSLGVIDATAVDRAEPRVDSGPEVDGPDPSAPE
jgi:high-affinity Fe2+/Pb2+ permease